MRIVCAAATLAVLLTGCKDDHRASARVGDNVGVTMVLSGMLSLQSDWHRTLIIERDGEAVSRQLVDDTGWWRGSNLYLAETGLYVLDEGQGGCIGFRLDPVRFDEAAARCHARRAAGSDMTGTGSTFGPGSDIYPGARYLGRFAEFPGEAARIAFISGDKAPEIRLPEPP